MNRILLITCLAWFALCAPAMAVETLTYTYDGAARLTTVVYEDGGTNAALHYQYDPNGNRTNLVSVAPGDTAFDSDGNGLSDLKELRYFSALGQDGAGDPDADGLVTSNEFATGANPTTPHTDADEQTDYEEWIADTDPVDAGSWFRISGFSHGSPFTVYFDSSARRFYTLSGCTDLVAGAWSAVAGLAGIRGAGGPDSMTDTNEPPRAFYRLEVKMAP